MVYLVTPLSPRYHQMTLEDFYSGKNTARCITENITNTKTYELSEIGEKHLRTLSINHLIKKLSAFNHQTEHLRAVDRHSLYSSFLIPKRSGGTRRIDAPNEDLKNALRGLKSIFEEDFHALYHTSAFAYVKKRSTVDCIKRHQANESKWFGKFDCSNFFGSTTLEFTMRMLSMIYPFSEVIKNPEGRAELEKAIELGFLDGGLPQGTPLSPMITNVIMIPIDYKLSNYLRENSLLYTRYADDILVSSKRDFNIKSVEALIIETFKYFDAPYQLNKKKTRYGSSSGSNWNLGVMLNKDNQITVGRKRIRQFEALMFSFVKDEQAGTPWDTSEVRVFAGQKSYYEMVEPEVISKIIAHFNQKHTVDLNQMIKNRLA